MHESAPKTSETLKIISEPSIPKKSKYLFGGKNLTEDINKEALRQRMPHEIKVLLTIANKVKVALVKVKAAVSHHV